jgi:hypothetical protein
MADKNKHKPEAAKVAEVPKAEKAPVYIACTPISAGKQYQIGEVFDITGLTEKQFNRLLSNGAIKLQAEE